MPAVFDPASLTVQPFALLVHTAELHHAAMCAVLNAWWEEWGREGGREGMGVGCWGVLFVCAKWNEENKTALCAERSERWLPKQAASR